MKYLKPIIVIQSHPFSAFRFLCTMDAFGVLTALGGDMGFFSGGDAAPAGETAVAAAAATGAGLAAMAASGLAAGGGVLFVAALGFSSSWKSNGKYSCLCTHLFSNR